MRHTIEELDRGQLDFMWNFLRFDCGQKSNIPALKEHLDMLRQTMIQKTGGQEKYQDRQNVDFNDLGTIINCIVIESMQLYLSGDLDRLEKLKASVQPEDKMGYWVDAGSLSCRCSECGCKNNKESNYCPECGTYMKGESNDETASN